MAAPLSVACSVLGHVVEQAADVVVHHCHLFAAAAQNRVIVNANCSECHDVLLCSKFSVEIVLNLLHCSQCALQQVIQLPTQHLCTLLNYLAGAAGCKAFVLKLFLERF